jgi:hypothetical protein
VELVKLPVPNELRENLPSLHMECWQFGECGIIVSRDDVADAGAQSRDFRWHLSISHPSRLPFWDEIKVARTLLSEELHFAMPFPGRAYWLSIHPNCFHLWEVQDENLTEQWEFDGIQARRSGQTEEEAPLNVERVDRT